MKKSVWSVLVISLIITMAGCKQQGQMKTQNVQNATLNMAGNDSIQKAFSNGRIRVMKNNADTKRSILQNTMHEQKMMMSDSALNDQFLRLNIGVNQMMTNNPSGKEQLTQSTLHVLDGISKSLDKVRSFMYIQKETRKKALKDEKLRNQILQQNLHEQYLALNDSATSTNVKQLSLQTTNAILNDPSLKTEMLKQNVRAFSGIAASPSLRSEMADPMLQLLKDPKITKELQKMIKLMLAKEMKKLQAKMMLMQKMQQQKLRQEKISHPKHHSSNEPHSGSESEDQGS